jgi:hypothetical protein
MTSSRSRSSSSEVHALQLFIFLVAISSGHARFRETRREVNFPANLRLQWAALNAALARDSAAADLEACRRAWSANFQCRTTERTIQKDRPKRDVKRPQ